MHPLRYADLVRPSRGRKNDQAHSMMMTILEARVPAERIEQVERIFATGAANLPDDIYETFLVRDASDPVVFRLVTVWRSREALEKTRGPGMKPHGTHLFEAAGATPALTVHDVVVHRFTRR